MAKLAPRASVMVTLPRLCRLASSHHALCTRANHQEMRRMESSHRPPCSHSGVQNHSEDLRGDGGPVLTSESTVTPAKAGAQGRTGSRPLPGRQEGGTVLKYPHASKRWIFGLLRWALPFSDRWKRLRVRIHAGLDCLQLRNHLRVDNSREPRHFFPLPLGRFKKHVQRAQVEQPAVPVSIGLLV